MERLTLFADVIVPLGVPNRYTYRVPFEMNREVTRGKRVLVQFGKARIYTGIIYQVHEKPPTGYEAKYIEAVLDDEPVVTDTQLKFWDWLGFYYCANPGEVMNAALPSGLKLSSTSVVQLNPDFNFEETEPEFFSRREHDVIDALLASPSLTFENLSEILQIKTIQPIVNSLIKKKAVAVYEDVKDKYKPKLETFLKLHPGMQDEQKLSETLNLLEKKAFKQAEAMLYFLHLHKSNGSEWVRKKEMLKKCEASAISALVKKQVLDEAEFEVGRLQFEKGNRTAKQLSPIQEQALQQCRDGFKEKKPVLLHGVTGSGKTEIYIELIRETLKTDKQVLMLIPEIALTTQLITRLRAVFGELVGVYHSRFSENERVEIWNNVLRQNDITHDTVSQKQPAYKIILGARSCLFLPYPSLGLVIIDEEHDNSFKQHDPSPRYHARDAALYLAGIHGANVLLGSATPSVESYYNTQQGKYRLVNLDSQFVKGGGTTVELCDITYFNNSGQMKASLTPPLFDAIEKALAKKEQIILFQNRRGFAPYTECRACGHVPHCVQCDVSLIYHKNRQKLVCHYCGYSVSPPKTCAACGSNQLHYKGMGTEKIEEDIEVLFPKAKTARMDLDSTRSKYAYKQLIDDFEGGNIDILIGTQMVTKGLDFNNVSVVGILNADSLLNFPDFRSFEKAYQLITQVRGRAGRSKNMGQVFVQTTQTDHKVISYVKENNYKQFFEDTLAERKQYNYPPFSRLFELNLISRDVNEVNHLSAELFNLLKVQFGDNLLGPEFPLISKIKNQYYKRILIKIPRQSSALTTRQFIFGALDELQHQYKDWRFKVSIDADPV